MIPQTPFYFIRHGETQWNRDGIVTGSSDVPLNELGIAQAIEAKKHLPKESITTICYSPLMRAQQTAEILNEDLRVPMIQMDGFSECSWGVYEGKLKGDRVWRDRWLNGVPVKHGELFQDFVRRVQSALEAALSFEGPVLIVAHGGVYWAILKILGHQYVNVPGIRNCVLAYHQPGYSEHDPWFIDTLNEDKEQ